MQGILDSPRKHMLLNKDSCFVGLVKTLPACTKPSDPSSPRCTKPLKSFSFALFFCLFRNAFSPIDLSTTIWYAFLVSCVSTHILSASCFFIWARILRNREDPNYTIFYSHLSCHFRFNILIYIFSF